ncbi:MAG TPA: fructose-6-phosphate aldolase [Methanomassiliicoccales archaeon]|nr:fructose-6-phosphate aldolase [Methanomassiliicoccales archaeon]HPR98189.1 fructose-6-phosphate aldolase [Methanomassiliicoccales archaeon]
MKIFIDTANIEQIKEVSSWGILDGVTTNPSLIAKEKKDFATIVNEICEVVDGPISVEVISLKADGMFAEGMKLAAVNENIVVKVPMTEEGLKATKLLSNEGVAVNMTLIFSANQALLAAKAGARYVSPFVGRLDDVGQDGMALISDIMDILDNYDFDTEVIVASVRDPIHVTDAARMGAHVATIPFDVLKKMFKHPLTDIGIERFLKDWEKVSKP